ncbi:CapA family protein [Pyxidicoccus parkwayensis]|uniref:CapA family protein n=1 Tax=Pyxidicoccus parkwayensis TaxID=2813578 RepID=A0ABX7NSW7_9BACT|nr:CapA family protein [Pyxidicoccus parkwaysis]QSQ21459.1 CapA family protein [Pyxidicoccus parkwaysis]
MASSVFLMLALATTPGVSPAREPAPSHKFSTAQARTAELLSSAGSASVKAALREDAVSGLAMTAGNGSVHAALRDGTATAAVLAGNGSVHAALGNGAAVAPVLAGAQPVKAAVTDVARAPIVSAAVLAGGESVPSSSASETSASGKPTPTSATSPTPEATVSDVGRVAAEAALSAVRAAAVALRTPSAPAVVDADASYARGVAALQAKDSRTAISELSACVQAVPSRVDCRWELGWAYQVEGRWTDALAQWTEVKKLAPEHPDLETALAQAQGQAALQEKLSRAPQAGNRPPPPPGAKVRIRAVGDVMLGTTIPEGHLPPEGPASVITAVRPLLEDADFTFANLEGPLCDGGKTTKCRSKGNCYAFRSPTEYGATLKEAGVDVVSTANNHSGDFGEECRRQTEGTLDALGIAWSGPPGSIATVERNGLRIGVVAFHTSPSCNHLNNLATATALVQAAAAEHDLVIVSFHGGAEGSKAVHVPAGREMFFGEDRGDLRTFTRAMVDAGANLVIGHGPHVVRGMEFYKGRLIAYSLGNFATYGRFTLTGAQGLGMVLEVELAGDGRFESARILPTKQVGEGISQPDPKAAVIPLIQGLTADDFPDTGARISDDGTVKPAGKGPVSAR